MQTEGVDWFSIIFPDAHVQHRDAPVVWLACNYTVHINVGFSSVLSVGVMCTCTSNYDSFSLLSEVTVSSCTNVIHLITFVHEHKVKNDSQQQV